MRLKFKAFDGRGRHYLPIIDEETGKEVGFVKSNGVGMYSGGGIEVSLFDDKYRRIFSRYEECSGFVEGVETVLNHMVQTKDRSVSNTQAA